MIIKRLTSGNYKPSIKGFPALGEQVKFSGEESPLGKIVAVNEESETIAIKFPGFSIWAGKSAPREYVKSETVILQKLEDSNNGWKLLISY